MAVVVPLEVLTLKVAMLGFEVLGDEVLGDEATPSHSHCGVWSGVVAWTLLYFLNTNSISLSMIRLDFVLCS